MTLSDLTGPGIEPKTSRTDSGVFKHYDKVLFSCLLLYLKRRAKSSARLVTISTLVKLGSIFVGMMCSIILLYFWQETDTILADEMGLGKTIQTIVFIKSLIAEVSALIFADFTV